MEFALRKANSEPDARRACRYLCQAGAKLTTTEKRVDRALNPPAESDPGNSNHEDDDVRWLIVMGPGNGAEQGYQGGLLVVVSKDEDGWKYFIRW
jgi:hypothetical protein